MNEEKKFSIGDRVRLSYAHKATGKVVDVEPGIFMNGARLCNDYYRVRWDDDGEVSGRLSNNDLEAE